MKGFRKIIVPKKEVEPALFFIYVVENQKIFRFFSMGFDLLEALGNNPYNKIFDFKDVSFYEKITINSLNDKIGRFVRYHY